MIAFQGKNGSQTELDTPAKQNLLRGANSEHHETKSELRENNSDLFKTTSKFYATTLKIKRDI